jgi:hypothetical protein
MVGDPRSADTSRFETVLEQQQQTDSRFRQGEDVSNPDEYNWSDSASNDEMIVEISKSIVRCAVREQQKNSSDFSVEHELRNSSPPFEGPRCDTELPMTVGSESDLLQPLSSRTRNALPRTGSVLGLPPAV